MGGGPSHAGIDLSVLRGHRFIACNSACRRVRPIATAEDWLYFHDGAWGQEYRPLLRDWPGIVASPNANRRLGEAFRRIELAGVVAAIGVQSIHATCSSGHTAACLAALIGAVRIVLVGFECCAVEGRTHGHDDYAMSATVAFGETFLPGWAALAPRFAAMGVDVINSTPGSAIDVFRRATLAEALA